MPGPILSTKLFIPRSSPELVGRPALVKRLNDAIRRDEGCFRHRLSLISAPAGFGKTTLISSFLSDCPVPSAWVSLDPADNDPVRFWKHIIAALQGIAPSIGRDALDALETSQTLSWELLLTGLVNDIVAVERPVILVLDDFHLLKDTRVTDGVVFLLEHQPAQLHLILLSRADPPWPLAGRRAKGELLELRAEDLRFSLDEAAVFLNDIKGLGLSEIDIAVLERRTEGWIAGLQLAALALGQTLLTEGRPGAAIFVKEFGGSHRLILDYLVEEVLERQPPVVRRFLLETSILERLTAPLCDALLSDESLDDDGSNAAPIRSDKMLLDLERRNLFLIPLDGERRWYRYHHLFADLLRASLGRARPDRIPILHLRASHWYEMEGMIEEAVEHALAAGDQDRAADLIAGQGMSLLEQGALPTLGRWLEGLREESYDSRPWLLIFQAWIYYYLGPREAVPSILERASAMLLKVGTAVDSARAEGHIAALRAYMELQHENLEEAEVLAREALARLPAGDYARAASAITLAESPREQGDLAASEQAYQRARDIAAETGNRPLMVSAVTYMGLQQAKQGRLQQAESTYFEAMALATGEDGRRRPPAGLPSVWLGDLRREWNNLDAAERLLTEGIDLCQRWGHSDALLNGIVSLARTRLAQGRLAEAQRALDEAVRLATTTTVDPWAAAWLGDGRVRLWLAMGQANTAAAWLAEQGLVAGDDPTFVDDLAQISLARVLVAGHRSAEALLVLERLLAKADSAGWLGKTIEILILKALALTATGSDSAMTFLTRALRLAEPAGYFRTVVDEGPSLAPLLTAAAASGASAVYARRLLSALQGETKEALDLRPASPIETLTQREQEVLRLLATDLTAPEIAKELFVSVNTVRTHVKHIYEKLGTHSRFETITRARELLLI